MRFDSSYISRLEDELRQLDKENERKERDLPKLEKQNRNLQEKIESKESSADIQNERIRRLESEFERLDEIRISLLGRLQTLQNDQKNCCSTSEMDEKHVEVRNAVRSLSSHCLSHKTLNLSPEMVYQHLFLTFQPKGDSGLSKRVCQSQIQSNNNNNNSYLSSELIKSKSNIISSTRSMSYKDHLGLSSVPPVGSGRVPFGQISSTSSEISSFQTNHDKNKYYDKTALQNKDIAKIKRAQKTVNIII